MMILSAIASLFRRKPRLYDDAGVYRGPARQMATPGLRRIVKRPVVINRTLKENHQRAALLTIGALIRQYSETRDKALELRIGWHLNHAHMVFCEQGLS